MPDRTDNLPERLLPSTTGSTLRYYRLMAEFPLRRMARELQCAYSSVIRWERDQAPMPCDRAIKYARALGLYIVITDTPPSDNGQKQIVIAPTGDRRE